MFQFTSVKKLLVLAVGGGNDSVSSLWLLRQLRERYGLAPEVVDILSMLLHGPEYHEVTPTGITGLVEIQPQSYRTIRGARIKAFPEPTLTAHRGAFGIRNVMGAHLNAGSWGFALLLEQLCQREHYDLVLGVDVGGDFIAVPENNAVLSPWMDAYAAFGLTVLQQSGVPVVGAVFGLGTDGESTPDMLDRALARIQPCEAGQLEPDILEPVTRFYVEVVRPQRRSQTGDLMVEMLQGNPSRQHTVTRYFNVWTAAGLKKFTVGQTFRTSAEYDLKFYLFSDLSRVRNQFVTPCTSSLDWVRKTQTGSARYSHELCNQEVEGTLVATPSWMFPASQRREILREICRSIKDGIYRSALLYEQDYREMTGQQTNGPFGLVHA